MNAPHRAARIDIAPDGGCSLRRIEAASGVEVEQLRAQHYQPEPTPASARDQALGAAAAWLAGIDAGAAGEQRQNHRQRCAITRLRLIEMRAADWLPTDEMMELTDAIDGVVHALRAATEHPRGMTP